MKITIDDPSHFLHESSIYDDDESEKFQSPSPPPPLQQRKHFCMICSKQFSSGKAYGGHVRIHSSEYNNKGKMKMKMKMKKKRKIGLVNKEKEKEIDLIRADVEGKIRCCLCRKEFQTMHSLFGHMRRHPDRSWKGIRPPPPEKLKLSFLDDDEDYNEVIRRSIMMSDITEDVLEAACCLMMLNYAVAGMSKAAIETANSEVRSYNDDKGKVKESEMDDNGLTIDKIKIEIEMKVNNPKMKLRRDPYGLI